MVMKRSLPYFVRRRLYWSSYDMFDRRRYHWLATLTFGTSQITFSKAIKKIKRFLLELQKSEGIQVACYCALCLKNATLHAHLLMVGRSNRTGKNLLDVEPGLWESNWKYQANIELIYDHDRAIGYVATQYLRNHYVEIVPYNKDLLNQTAHEWEHRGPCVGGAEDLARISDLDED